MPRVSRAQTAQNRLLIEEVSARLMREQGINGVSVADLMAAAGLTHGGFYGHFESKDALAAVVCGNAFDKSMERWRTRVAGQPDAASAIQALVDGYLTRSNRDEPGSGCPAAGLAVDVARESADKPVRAAYIAGVRDEIDLLQSLQQTGDASTDRRQAIHLLATLIGAMVLARGTRGDKVSSEFLQAVRTQLRSVAPINPLHSSPR